MEERAIDRIFAGNFTGLPKVKHPLVRIYTSSTYTDMTLEKNVLVTEVYPKLKEYCRERYGLEFQVWIPLGSRSLSLPPVSFYNTSRLWTCAGECGTRPPTTT